MTATQKLPGLDALIADNAQKVLVDSSYTLGERIKDWDARYSGFRTLYPIYRGGDLIAFVGVKVGFGRGWKVWAIKLAPEGARLQFKGAQPEDGGLGTRQMFHVVAKERAVEQLQRHIKEFNYKFPTLAELAKDKANAQGHELVLAKAVLEGLRTAKAALERQIKAFDKVIGEAMNPTSDEWTDLGSIKFLLTNELARRQGNTERQGEYVAKLEMRNGSQTAA